MVKCGKFAGFFGGVKVVDPGFDAVHVAAAGPVAAVGAGDAFGAFAVIAEG